MTKETIRRQFLNFHIAHPEVYVEILELCRQWVSRGTERWSIDGVFEVLRWQRRFRDLPAAGEEFKLNNNYRAHYARLVVQEPGLASIFELRKLKTP